MKSLWDGLKSHACAIKSGFVPSIFSSNQLIHLCSKNGLFQEAQNLFDEMPKRNIYTWNAVIKAYLRAQNFSKAQTLFDAAPQKDSVTYNSLISGYANNDGYANQAINLFLQMQQESNEARIDEFTVTIMLNMTAKLSLLSGGQQLHSFMMKTADNLSKFAVSSLIDMYSKCGSFHDALRVFNECDHHGVADPVWKNPMMAACCREGELEMAQKLFWGSPEVNDTVSWNTMIAGYAQNGHEKEAIQMFTLMVEEGFTWNEHTLASILSACTGLKIFKMGKEIHAWVLKGGTIMNPFISSGIVDFYCKCGDMKCAESVREKIMAENFFATTSMIVGYLAEGNIIEARRLFDLLTEKNYVVWTAMISGYIKYQKCDDAFELFSEFMEKDGRIHDALMFINLLGACTIRAIVDPGKQIHAYMVRTGIDMDEKIVGALVDMYSKCGNIKYAKQVFQSTTFRDLVLYNVMIAGYAHHGYEYEAIRLFEKMIAEGPRPDEVTFVAILSACRHCGLVEAGEKYFSSMTEEYAVSPESKHYACMIDLYGRANQLEKALEFMEKIPMEIDAVILGTFLNACRMNRNVDLAKAAEDMLLNLEGDNGARYVQLAGAYASEGKWDEMGRIMKKMRGKEVKKLAGCSWVQVGNKLYSFISGDRSHSETEAFYAILNCLVQGLEDKLPIEKEIVLQSI